MTSDGQWQIAGHMGLFSDLVATTASNYIMVISNAVRLSKEHGECTYIHTYIHTEHGKREYALQLNIHIPRSTKPRGDPEPRCPQPPPRRQIHRDHGPRRSLWERESGRPGRKGGREDLVVRSPTSSFGFPRAQGPRPSRDRGDPPAAPPKKSCLDRALARTAAFCRPWSCPSPMRLGLGDAGGINAVASALEADLSKVSCERSNMGRKAQTSG
jgi:hypothetical protein